jgi:hypothetical protein
LGCTGQSRRGLPDVPVAFPEFGAHTRCGIAVRVSKSEIGRRPMFCGSTQRAAIVKGGDALGGRLVWPALLRDARDKIHACGLRRAVVPGWEAPLLIKMYLKKGHFGGVYGSGVPIAINGCFFTLASNSDTMFRAGPMIQESSVVFSSS